MAVRLLQKSCLSLQPLEQRDCPSRVLIIGDSISIGYTPHVVGRLEEAAEVHRIPINGGSTDRGLEHIDEWLGDGDWDVIHFNWGLHDIRLADGRPEVPLEEYRANLEELVDRLMETGADLVFATTTPVPPRAGKRLPRDARVYNRAAREIMDAHDIAINDLFGFVAPKRQRLQLPANVHFRERGYRRLGRVVARQIEHALIARNAAAATSPSQTDSTEDSPDQTPS